MRLRIYRIFLMSATRRATGPATIIPATHTPNNIVPSTFIFMVESSPGSLFDMLFLLATPEILYQLWLGRECAFCLLIEFSDILFQTTLRSCTENTWPCGFQAYSGILMLHREVVGGMDYTMVVSWGNHDRLQLGFMATPHTARCNHATQRRSVSCEARVLLPFVIRIIPTNSCALYQASFAAAAYVIPSIPCHFQLIHMLVRAFNVSIETLNSCFS